MTDDQILFRELRGMLQTDSGRGRFCRAILGKGQPFLEHPEALRIAIMATMPYRAYLLTAHWRTTSSAAKERAGNRCQLCNGTQHLETHHRTYERRGCEEDGDLTVLCDECHGKFHTAPTPDDSLEPSASDPIEMRLAGMTDEEQMQCISETIRQKRLEQGIKPDGTGPLKVPEKPISSILAQSGKRSRACSSARKR
jgi:hypothetical protein